jgi:hypothetical protein
MTKLKFSVRFFILFSCLLLVFFLVGGKGFAQTTLVTLEGTVTDVDGVPLPGVTITARNVDTGYDYSSLSRADGTYIISGIEPGNYEIEVRLSAFATEIRKGLTFNVGARLSIDFELKPSTLEEEITVVAQSPMVEVTKSEISGVVKREHIDNLPLLDRDFSTLSLLTAGAQEMAGGGMTSNALPYGMGDVTVDGVANEHGISNGPRIAIPADAIQEFRVMTNMFAAEYGNAAGMLRTAITRSGTNDFRGRASFYFRDEMFDTPNYFANHDGYQGDKIEDYEKPNFKHLNPSAYLGGPIIKDKLHFFVNYEGFFRETYALVTSPLVEQESVAQPQTSHRLMLKLNYQLNEKNHFMLRVNANRNKSENMYIGGLITKEWAVDYPEYFDDFQLSWTAFPSDNAINEVKILYAADNYTYFSSDPAQNDAFSIIRPSGYFGKPTNAPQSGWTKRLEVLDNYTIIKGDHTIKLGFDYHYAPMGGNVTIMKPGLYVFGVDDEFNPANPFTYPVVFQRWAGDTIFTMPQHMLSVFAQDSWNVSPQFTLNYGLRYNYYTMSEFDVTTFHIPANLCPRIGFSWDPVGDGRTSIRGGIGTFTSNFFGNLSFSYVYLSLVETQQILFPNYPDPDLSNPWWPFLEQALGMPPGFLQNQGGAQSTATYTFKDGLVPPHTLQATLGVQREVFTNLSIGVDLVYTRGYNLFTEDNENPVIPGTGGVRVDPTRGDAFVVTDHGKSDFKSVYFTLNKRYSNGWSLEFTYTLGWSKSDVEFIAGVDSYEDDGWDRLYGYTDSDSRHKIVAAGIVDLPLSFQLSGTFMWRSARPWTPEYGYDENLDTLVSDYIDYHRNEQRGFSHLFFNLRLSWFLNISQARIQVFAEMYNVTNYTNFTNISGNKFTSPGVESPIFSQPTVALDPRLIQLGIRFDF